MDSGLIYDPLGISVQILRGIHAFNPRLWSLFFSFLCELLNNQYITHLFAHAHPQTMVNLRTVESRNDWTKAEPGAYDIAIVLKRKPSRSGSRLTTSPIQLVLRRPCWAL